MVGQIIDTQVANFTISRARRRQGTSDITFFVVGTLLVMLLVLGYIYIPNRMVELDYQIEQSKKALHQLSQETEFLTMKEAEMTSLARLETEAHHLGMEPVGMNRVRYVDVHQPSRVLMAMSSRQAPQVSD